MAPGVLVIEGHIPGKEIVGRVVGIAMGLSVLLSGTPAFPLASRYEPLVSVGGHAIR